MACVLFWSFTDLDLLFAEGASSILMLVFLRGITFSFHLGHQRMK